LKAVNTESTHMYVWLNL